MGDRATYNSHELDDGVLGHVEHALVWVLDQPVVILEFPHF